MSKNTRHLLLLWNSLAMAVFILFCAHAFVPSSDDANSKVTELDRAGVIDEGKLRESFPSLAGNVRNDLGRWIAEKDRTSADWACKIGIAVAAVNAAAFLLACRKKRNSPS